MALPNTGMSFSPFAILTAEELNDMVENIEALAAGTGLNDGSITPEKLQSGTGTSWPWATFALSWTNLTPGNGTTDYAKYSQVGKDVKCRTKFTLGSTSSASGIIKQSLPVTSISYGASPFQAIGHGVFYDVSANIYYPIGVLLDSTSNITFHMMQTASTFGTLFYLDNANPVTPANGDFIQASYFYEAA